MSLLTMCYANYEQAAISRGRAEGFEAKVVSAAKTNGTALHAIVGTGNEAMKPAIEDLLKKVSDRENYDRKKDKHHVTMANKFVRNTLKRMFPSKVGGIIAAYSERMLPPYCPEYLAQKNEFGQTALQLVLMRSVNPGISPETIEEEIDLLLEAGALPTQRMYDFLSKLDGTAKERMEKKLRLVLHPKLLSLLKPRSASAPLPQETKKEDLKVFVGAWDLNPMFGEEA
jgi:hypothetical protein